MALVPEPLQPLPPPPFREVFDEHYAYVCASLRRMGVAEREKEDAAVDVFFRVHQRLEGYDVARPMKPWLFAFVVRVASEFRRRRRRSREVADDARIGELPSGAPDPHADLDREADRQLVLDALEALDADKRTVFILHDLDEVSVPQIAAGLGLAEGTVYTRLRAARARFAAAVRRSQEGRR